MDFTKSCACCGQELIRVRNANLEAWRKEVAGDERGALIGDLGCPRCGCELRLHDARTEIGHADVSRPQIHAIERLPGGRLRLRGHRLDGTDVKVTLSGTPVETTAVARDVLELQVPLGVRTLTGEQRTAFDDGEVFLIEVSNSNGRHKRRGRALSQREVPAFPDAK